MKKYLQSKGIFHLESALVKKFVERYVSAKNLSKTEQIVTLYYAVRDHVKYNPFRIKLDFQNDHLDQVLYLGEGHCVDKASLFITGARILGVPSRLGLAKVKNHMGTSRLEKILKTKILVPHGYAEAWLNDKWVKCTPAFNLELCEKLKVSPLDWDGKTDSVFQQYHSKESLFMEYIEDYGSFSELPIGRIKELLQAQYPHMFDKDSNWNSQLLESI